MIDLFSPNEIYTESRELFERYAAFDGNADEISCNYHALQVKLARWQVRNFGNVSVRELPLMVALGICEEICCEWVTALTIGSEPELLDAVGDALIFLAQLLTLNRLSIGPLLKYASTHPVGDPVVQAGKLAHIVLKRAQKIRTQRSDEEHRELLSMQAHAIVRSFGMDARRAFAETAKTVLARDWVKNPTTGAVS